MFSRVGQLLNGDAKYVWAGAIAIFSLLGLTVTTVVSLYHWPIDNGEIVRQTNTTFSNVLTFVLGVFTGAALPTGARQLLMEKNVKDKEDAAPDA